MKETNHLVIIFVKTKSQKTPHYKPEILTNRVSFMCSKTHQMYILKHCSQLVPYIWVNSMSFILMGKGMACPFRTLVVLYRMFPFIICLILMNYLMEFYFIGFVNAHLPGCFCPWTFRLNIGLNTSPSDSFVSYLNSHLGYSAGEFQALQLIVLAVFGAVD